jgi:hypothetical protein
MRKKIKKSRQLSKLATKIGIDDSHEKVTITQHWSRLSVISRICKRMENSISHARSSMLFQ